MRVITAIAVACLVVLAGCTAPGANTAPGVQDGGGPEDPDSDVLGWENGYWYNETVSVDRSDGLNDSEMERVVARSMARVERIRGLEFDETVPVSVISRSEFRRQQGNDSTPPDLRLFDNAKFEAMFLINESTDSIAVQRRNSGTAVGGYYSPTEGEIVIVSDNESSPRMNEITLSQELFHALQDQKFNISSFDQSTRELHNAKDGVIEGDGNYVDYLYEQRCNDEWSGTCLRPASQSGSGGELANIGTYLLKFQPYSDGPAFVRHVKRTHESQGWEAVNALYENPPASTEQVIHPEKYPDDEPATFGIEDTASDGWQRLTLDERPSYGSVGEAGLFTMFMHPAFETGGQTQLVPAQNFFNRDANGDVSTVDPYDYNSTYSAGWDGDKLAVYTNDAAGENETGYVWKTVWDSPKDAEEFVEGYERLLQYHQATAVEGRQNTWTISGRTGFDDAFYVEQQGKTVVIVNAPGVEALSNVREGAASND